MTTPSLFDEAKVAYLEAVVAFTARWQPKDGKKAWNADLTGVLQRARDYGIEKGIRDKRLAWIKSDVFGKGKLAESQRQLADDLEAGLVGLGEGSPA